MDPRLLPLAASVAVVAADRATKIWVDRHVSAWDIHAVIPGFLNIIHAENPGMAFSLLANADQTVRRIVLVGLASLVLALVAVMFWRAAAALERWSLALVLGGAVGNLWDRLARGTVTDFVDLYFRDWHWATFNVADASITTGAILLALHMMTARPAPAPSRQEP